LFDYSFVVEWTPLKQYLSLVKVRLVNYSGCWGIVSILRWLPTYSIHSCKHSQTVQNQFR